MTFRREIQFLPGYDYREDPARSKYGCHGMEIRFLLHGPKMTVQFLLYTNWLPTWDEFDRKSMGPLPADLGYHADEPVHGSEDERECQFRERGKCYYDGSALAANEVFKLLVSEGEEAVWSALENRYAEWSMDQAENKNAAGPA